MIEMVRDLAHWLEGFAGGEWAIAALAATAFTESIFFPIPPDPLLIGMSLLQPELALLFAAIATLASVAGAVVGYWLGKLVGRPILDKLDRFIPADKVNKVEAMFNRYGALAIIIAAITPIPYKVFAVTAGVLGMPLAPFIIASLIGRGARMMLIGALIFVFGDSIQQFLETRLEVLIIAGSAGALALGAGYLLVMRMRTRRNRATEAA